MVLTITLFALLAFTSTQAQQLSVVSANTGGGAGCDEFNSLYPLISDNGRYVTFASQCNNLSGSVKVTGSFTNVYRRDIETGTTELVSLNITQTGGGNEGSYALDISTDGRFVLFNTGATNLHSDGLNQGGYFVRDLQTQTNVRVTMPLTGCEGPTGVPVISGDGNTVIAAIPRTCNLGNADIYAWNRLTGVTTLVSGKLGTNLPASGSSPSATVNADGHYVVFSSYADDIVQNDQNGQPDVFVRDMVTGVTSLVSVNFAGNGSGNGGSLIRARYWDYTNRTDITPDGHYLAFTSGASDLVAGESNRGAEVYVRDLWNGTTMMIPNRGRPISNRGSYAIEPQLTPDGNQVLFQVHSSDMRGVLQPAYLYQYSFVSGKTRLVTPTPDPIWLLNQSDFWPVGMSPDGRFVAYSLRRRGDSNYGEVFVRDLETGTITSITAAETFNFADGVVMAPLTGTIAFSSTARLLPMDANLRFDIYAYQPLVGQRKPRMNR